LQSGCLNLEDEMVDATTEEGKKLLREMEEISQDN
jgi:hypothetical protein